MATAIVVAHANRAVATAGGRPAAATALKNGGNTAVMIRRLKPRIRPVIHRPGPPARGEIQAEAIEKAQGSGLRASGGSRLQAPRGTVVALELVP